uniref:Ecdysone-induced protein 74EF n=1 Tax=Loa loa TaxID=7209 RepID=A0A1I7W1V8_LOALO
MKRITGTVFPTSTAPISSLIDYSNFRDRDENEIVMNELLDTITNEETCSLNSTSISIDHSHDSVLDFSICSNPIDEAAIMEEQLAANGELNDDVPSIVATLSSRAPKDSGHSSTNRAIFTTAVAVASTTDNNCQPLLPASSSLATAYLLPLFSAPPIASLEDLTNGNLGVAENFKDLSQDLSHSKKIPAIDCSEGRKTGRGRIGQGVGIGKDGDDGDNDDVSGKSDYYRQTSSAASTTIKRYIIRSGWFFRPYQHSPPPPPADHINHGTMMESRMSSPPSEPPPPPPPKTPSELSSQKMLGTVS